LPLLRPVIDARVQEAQRLREQIQQLAASDDIPEKARLLKEANEALEDVQAIGDLAVSAFFERERPRDRQTLRATYAAKVEEWLSRGLGSAILVDVASGFSRTTFHWEIEFPEVFTRANPGFDAFVGNPPFAGKNTITASNGANYLQWLLTLHAESHGNADLVAHFYRRAFYLLRGGGTFGLIATNTIAQGDTRGTGLRWIRHHVGTIYVARKRIKWPGEAAVVVSVVHVHKGVLSGPFELDGRQVDVITAFLFHTGGDEDPQRLEANANKSFQGSIVLGMGFTFDDTDRSGVANPIALMRELIRKDPRNAERIFPFIGGEEVNDSPTHAHHRYVINFGQMSEGEARQWPDLMGIVETKVKRDRLAQNDEGAKRFWWQFIRPRPELHEAIRGLDRILVCTLHQEHWVLTHLQSDIVFSHALGVFAYASEAALAVMQSRVHEVWARFLGSTLEERFRYTPSDCFETFPFPKDWESSERLESAGREYYEFRGALMVRNREGLTATYNRFHDPNETSPEVVRLREVHDAMDHAVLDAYGWTDIRPTCEFLLDYEDEEADDSAGRPSRRRKPWRYRWPDDIRDEVLGRLLDLNAQRASTESAGMAHEKRATPSAKSRRMPSRPRMPLLLE
jgi:hypothetical protein